DLALRGVPSQFVVLARRPSVGTTAYAKSLVRRLNLEGNVLVLAPGSLGLASSRVSAAKLNLVFRSRLPLLKQNPVRGTIAVANDLAVRFLRAAGGPHQAHFPVGHRLRFVTTRGYRYDLNFTIQQPGVLTSPEDPGAEYIGPDPSFLS